MDEELREDLEVQGEENVPVEEDIIEQREESVIEIPSVPWTGSILEQMEDGSWRHAEDSPFSPFYVPDRKQTKNNRITIALVGLLLLLLIAGMIFAVSKLVEAAMGEAKTAWNESSSAIGEFWEEFKDEFEEELEADRQEEYNEYDEYEEYEEYDDYVTEDGFTYVDGMYQPTPEDDFYLELADSIRDDLSYSVDIEEYEVNDNQSDVTIYIRYAELSGDNPYIDEINEYLKEGAMYYAEEFNSEYTTGLFLTVSTFVTYMDEETLSVAIDERYNYQGDVYFNLYCMNFDLTTGTYLYNTDIIEPSYELVEAFKEQSDYQNGETSSVYQYTDEEILEFMSNEATLILYYTPVGLEVGYNHPDGWISVTFKEYEQFLKTL